MSNSPPVRDDDIPAAAAREAPGGVAVVGGEGAREALSTLVRQLDGSGMAFGRNALVQAPSAALAQERPRSAIDAGAFDACLEPEAIGEELMRLSAQLFAKPSTRLFGEQTRSSGSTRAAASPAPTAVACASSS